jgi:stress-induced-phosphoprotein 1
MLIICKTSSYALEFVAQAKAMQDPEIQNILSDPIMRQVLTDFQENPKAAQEHMKNPMVMGKIQKLVNAGIVQVR